MSAVKIDVKADLQEVLKQLGLLKSQIEKIETSLQEAGKEGEKALKEGMKGGEKAVENYMDRLRSLGKTTLGNLKEDFKALFSLNAISGALKMSDKFRDQVSHVLTLNDAIRKMGSAFGIAEDRFDNFQANLQKGLGDVGLSGEAAANALEGLVGTQVKGEEAIISYAKQAAMLASIAGEQGQEGAIARELAGATQATGLGPEQVAASVAKIASSLGVSASEAMKRANELFKIMRPEDVQKMGLKALESMSAITTQIGPQAADLFKDILSSKFVGTELYKALGAEGIMGEQGLDVEKFKAFAESIFAKAPDRATAAGLLPGIGGDVEKQEAFVRLYDQISKVTDETERMNRTFKGTEQTMISQRGLSESFKAAFSNLFGTLQVGRVTQPLTDIVSGLAESKTGSAALVGGGALAAAVLAGVGTRGLGGILGKSMGGGVGGMIGGIAKGKAMEQAGVQPVYVVNASEIGVGGAAGAIGSSMGMLGKAGLVGAAGAVGYGVGSLIEPIVSETLDKLSSEQTQEGIGGMNVLERAFLNFSRLTGLGLDERTQENLIRSEAMVKGGQIKVVMADPRLKEVHTPTRGGAN